jgi:DNA-binding response OmpR family regulator
MPPAILIVEDDPALLRGLKDNFAARGYAVECAVEGEAGLTAALRGTHQLIVLDIMLPRVNGYEICRAARERGLAVPIIMLTAKGQEEDIILGLNLGADDYVTKPFRIGELMARVSALLRRNRREDDRIFRFGEIEFHAASRTVFRSGRELELTAKELKLLAYLVEKQGRALTREQILDAVWGNSIVVTARSVDRCVTTLRAKIEPDPHNPTYIHTLREIGYRFQPE